MEDKIQSDMSACLSPQSHFTRSYLYARLAYVNNNAIVSILYTNLLRIDM